MQRNMEFANSLNGMKNFLRQCEAVSMAVSVGACIDEAIRTDQLDPGAPLTLDSLEAVRQNLFRRMKADPSSGQTDVMLFLADVMRGGGASLSMNPFESRLAFVERLQNQLKESGRVNFQRAFAEANRG